MDNKIISNFNMDQTDIELSVLSTIIKMLIDRKWIDDYDIFYNMVTKNNVIRDNLNLIDITTIENNDLKIAIKFYKSKLNTIKNDKDIENFINSYITYHKIIIVNDITSKAEKQIIDFKNLEIFKINEVIKNIAEHHLVPKHKLLSKEEGNQVLNEYKLKKKDMGRICIDDPMVRYLYAKKNDIIQIIRPSVYSGYSTYYRLVCGNSIYN